MNGLLDSKALNLARAVIAYFDGSLMQIDEEDYLKCLAYEVQQQEEMKLWNI